jgi:hypothetical protein
MKIDKFELLGDTIIIALGLILLVVGVIEQCLLGEFYGQEPNSLILYSELFISIIILILGINRIYTDRHTQSKREYIGDIIILSGGFILSGMFLTIALKGDFFMPKSEVFILFLRSIISTVLIVLGIERLIDDLRSI